MKRIRLNNKLDIYNLIAKQITQNPTPKTLASNPASRTQSDDFRRLPDNHIVIIALNSSSQLICTVRIPLDELNNENIQEYFDTFIEKIKPHNPRDFIVITFTDKNHENINDIIFKHDFFVFDLMELNYNVAYDDVEYPLNTILKTS